MKKKLLCLMLFVLSLPWFYKQNNELEVNEIKIFDKRIPISFDGFRIVQLSDFHNTTLGKENNQLIEQLKEAKPNIIVITGDFIDSRMTDVDKAISFIEKIKDIAPIYYVTGNHESRVKDEYDLLEKSFHEFNVNVLRNDNQMIEMNQDKIQISGIDDPAMFKDKMNYVHYLNKLGNKDIYTILLSHRPEYFDLYVEYEYPLVLCGHAHGGQIRLPFIGGILAPGQGFFPKYDAGLYHKKNTNMIVSRGIGNSLFPLRINNHPEIIVIELNRK